jgi:N,N-dimethylformamidase
MQTVAYVSDEYYFAVANTAIEISGAGEVIVTESSPSGAVRAELAPGSYDLVVAKEGYGPKRSRLTVGDGVPPLQIRLLSDDVPLGYMWPKWVRSGEQSELRIHSSEPYVASLFRYGWEAEPILDLTFFDDIHPKGALRQVLPDGDTTETGAQWVPHHMGRQMVTAPEKSGLYYVHVETSSGAFTSFPWIVAPSTPSARIAVLASSFDWNAYNDFGGRSNYVLMEKLTDAPTVSFRQDHAWHSPAGFAKWEMDSYAPLSFDRPEPLNALRKGEKITDPIEPVGSEHVAPAEWRFLGWLEREGFDYDLYADSQLDDGTLVLDEYEILVLSAHPEYWTRQMYDLVYEWVFERGGRLMYLGGNGVDCEVAIDEEGRMCVLNGRATDWGPRAESRLSGRGQPTGALLGVVATLDGMGTAAPYEVLEPEHWIFAGTGLQQGDLFGFESLDVRNPGGASGHETDKLSASAPRTTRVLARGVNPDNGGAEIAYFETDSGGRVFSTGSISYVCSIPIDDQISRITRTVIENFLSPKPAAVQAGKTLGFS